jgi:chitinase
MTLLTPAFDLAAASKASGLKDYTLAFVVDGGGCKASWGGYAPVAGAPFASDIIGLRAAGGDVIGSFGGAANQELAQTCTTVSALAAQYQSVVDTYHLTSIDFDIEGAAVADPTSIARRSQAIAILERNAAAAGRKLQVSLTLPVLPNGLTSDGLNVIRSAMANGVRIDVVNVMAMDYGDWAAPNPAGQMGPYAIDAAQATHDQLATLYPSDTDAQLWRTVGVTPLIGVNDLTNEVFTLSDASKLVSFAQSKNLGRLAFWSATRDRECPGGAQTYSGPSCSSIVQSDWAFSRAFSAYTG